MLDTIHVITTRFADLAWGPWLLWLLLGGGFYFLVLSRFTPFRYLRHAFDLIRGKYDDPKNLIYETKNLSSKSSMQINLTPPSE